VAAEDADEAAAVAFWSAVSRALSAATLAALAAVALFPASVALVLAVDADPLAAVAKPEA